MEYVYVCLMDGLVVGVVHTEIEAMIWVGQDPVRRKFHETTWLH